LDLITKSGIAMAEGNVPITRRSFVYQSGVLAGSAVLAASAAATDSSRPGDLPRRRLGKTGESVTALTLGTAPVGFFRPHSPRNVAECVNTAIDLGVNFIDTARAYDVAEEGVGLALGKRRKEVFLATKVMADNLADAEKSFSTSLRLLKTDCVDLVYYHNLGERKVETARNDDGVFTWLLKQKQAGKTRFVGISGHSRPAKFTKLLESGDVDVLLVVINFVDRYTYGFESEILPLARKHDVGIVAMKVFGGARAMSYTDSKMLPQLDPQYLELAARYAMGVPGVATLNIGVHNAAQVKKNVETIKRYLPLNEAETAQCQALGKQLAKQWGPHFGPVAGAGYLRNHAEDRPVAQASGSSWAGS
jgi:uncharacterized protein